MSTLYPKYTSFTPYLTRHLVNLVTFVNIIRHIMLPNVNKAPLVVMETVFGNFFRILLHLPSKFTFIFTLALHFGCSTIYAPGKFVFLVPKFLSLL